MNYMKAKELAQHIPYSESWIRKQTCANLIPYYKLNDRNILYNLDEVLKMIESKRVDTIDERYSKHITKKFTRKTNGRRTNEP